MAPMPTQTGNALYWGDFMRVLRPEEMYQNEGFAEHVETAKLEVRELRILAQRRRCKRLRQSRVSDRA